MNTQTKNRSSLTTAGVVNERESQLTLELLQAIEQKDDISQRDLAQGMGVALGLANSYLKRCVKKGWVKITTAPANRYMYYLTPIGFAEKARLTADFFATSLALFRQSGEVYSDVFDHCAVDGKVRLVLAGLSDLTEIALMRSMKSKIEVVAVYQPDSHKTDFFGVPLLNVMPESALYDAVVLTSMEQTSELICSLEELLGETQQESEKIIVPSLLLNMSYRNDHPVVEPSSATE